MAIVTITLDASRLNAARDEMLANLAGMASTMEAVSVALRDGLPLNISAVDSPELSEEYAARKAKKYPGKPLLRASDALYSSFREGHDDNEAWAGPIGIPYDAAQNYGYPAGNLPERPYMYIDESLGDRVFGMICDAVRGKGAA